MKINVILNNVTPYHSSQPGVARVNIDGKFQDGSQGFPCVRTRRMPVMGATNEEGLARSRYIPIMPANSLRHEVREACLELVFDQLRDRQTISIGAYAAAKCGNATGNPDGVPATFAESVAIRQHPFLGLFGGGPRMIQGRLSVDAAYPITADALPIIGDGFEEWLVSGRLTNVEFKRRVDPVVQMDAEASAMIADAATSITEWSANNQDENEEGGRGLRAFNAHEIVVPGVAWLWRIDVKNPTPAQQGLLLMALSGLHRKSFGGMGSLGYGQVMIRSITVDGESVWGGDSLLENQTVMNACDAWSEASDSIDATQFEAFVASNKSEKPVKEKKK